MNANDNATNLAGLGVSTNGATSIAALNDAAATTIARLESEATVTVAQLAATQPATTAAASQGPVGWGSVPPVVLPTTSYGPTNPAPKYGYNATTGAFVP